MQDKTISDTLDKEKDRLISDTSGTVVSKDKDTTWSALTKTKKQELMNQYYNAEELQQLTVADLDAIAPDKFINLVAEVEAAPEIIIP
jgi:hypothetical protein